MANSTLHVAESGSGTGFAWARINDSIIVSYYSSPNCPLAEYEAFIDQLGDLVRSSRGSSMVIGGDFNAHSANWGCSSEDTRGLMLSETGLHHMQPREHPNIPEV